VLKNPASTRRAALAAVAACALTIPLLAPFGPQPSARAQEGAQQTQQTRPRRVGQQQQPAPTGTPPASASAAPRAPAAAGGEEVGEDDVVRVETELVFVPTVVTDRTGRPITNLRAEDFAVFEDGERKDITNFSTPEAPITVAMVMEYSNLTNYYLRGDYYEPGRYEVLRPMAQFLSQFVRPPEDYVSVIAYDMRVTPLTDFTNDPNRINTVVGLLLRSRPVSNEANLFDALKLVLVGGRADSVVLEESKERTAEYAGMATLQGRRKAVFLISSGVDTFSKINYDEARKIAQNAGVPIYIIGTGNLFFKKYGDNLPAEDGLLGNVTPGRMTLLQAQNALKTFAKETGGEYFPITFPGELNSALSTINALMRNQYSLGYNPGDRRDGKKHKIEVRVDVDGDGQFDDKEFIVKARQFYNAPKEGEQKTASTKQ
jgi:VWFA-related protein